MQVIIREATNENLPFILQLYGQPDIDNGKVLSTEEAESIFEKMSSYPMATKCVFRCNLSFARCLCLHGNRICRFDKQAR